MRPQRHQACAIGWREGAACTALPILLAILVGGARLREVLAGGLVNPDSYMRLVRLQAELAAGAPLHVAARDGSGAGAVLHWSHLLDMAVCLLAAPFTLWLPPDAALHAAGVLFGPLALGLLGLAAAWAVAPFATRQWRWLAPLLIGLAPALVSYGVPGVVHHHVPVAIAITMTAGWAARLIVGLARPGAGWPMGAWAAVGIWLTPESMPLTLLAFGLLWLAWLVAPRRPELARTDLARAIAAAGAAFALVILAALAVDPPATGYGAVEIDRLSAVFAGLGLAVAAVGGSVLAIERLGLAGGRRATAGVLAGLVALAAWVMAFPAVLGGPGGIVRPEDWHAMFDHIAEMEPLSGALALLRHLLTGSLAALLFACLAWRHRSLPLAGAALAVAGCVAAGWVHQRFAAYPELAGAVVLPITLTLAERGAARWPEARAAGLRLAVLAAFLIVPLAGSVLHPARAAEGAPAGRCSVAGLGPMLAPHAGAVVLARVNDTPELLYRAQVLTVGSLYHRNMAAFHRLAAAWLSLPSAREPPAVAATRASLVLSCGRGEPASVPPDSLAGRLARGDVPPWLVPIADDHVSGNILYRVVR